MGSPAREPDNALTRLMRAAAVARAGGALPPEPAIVGVDPFETPYATGLTPEEQAYRDRRARELGLVADLPEEEIMDSQHGPTAQERAAYFALSAAVRKDGPAAKENDIQRLEHLNGGPVPFQITGQAFRVVSIDLARQRVVTDAGYVDLEEATAAQFQDVAARYVLAYSIERLQRVAASVGVNLELAVKNVHPVQHGEAGDRVPAQGSGATGQVSAVSPASGESAGTPVVESTEGDRAGTESVARVFPGHGDGPGDEVVSRA